MCVCACVCVCARVDMGSSGSQSSMCNRGHGLCLCAATNTDTRTDSSMLLREFPLAEGSSHTCPSSRHWKFGSILLLLNASSVSYEYTTRMLAEATHARHSLHSLACHPSGNMHNFVLSRQHSMNCCTPFVLRFLRILSLEPGPEVSQRGPYRLPTQRNAVAF